MTSAAAAPSAGAVDRLAGLRRLPGWTWPLIALTVAAIAIGTFIRVSLLGVGSLWLDELWTLDAISRSFRELVGARLISDSNPPLWIVLSWLWLRLVRTYDPAMMRLLPLVFSLLAIGAPLLGAVRLPSLRPTMLVLAALLALSLFPLQFAVELRSYSMLIAFGTAATVVWAGLLTGDLPKRGAWIFAFALTGALAGFSHYYGQLLYFGELGILVASWVRTGPLRPVGLLVGWAGLSLLPVVVWLVATRQWFPLITVAPPPSFSIIRMSLAYGLAPVSNLLADRGPGYPDFDGPETVVFALLVAVLLGTVAYRVTREPGLPIGGPALVGLATLAVLALGVAAAWVASIVLPPSMNYRNMAALVPVFLLAVAAAATLPRGERTRWLTGALAVVAWLAAEVAFVAWNGVAVLGPAWQQQAGYGPAAEAIVRAASTSPSPTLVGLETTWGWHGQWDAVLRASLASAPTESSEPAPLPIRWIGGVADLEAAPPPEGPIVVFSDTFDSREADLVAWVETTRGPCDTTTYGGPAFGVVITVACP